MEDFQRKNIQRIYNPELDDNQGRLAIDAEYVQATRTPKTNSPPVVITDENRFPRPSNGGRKKSKKSRKSRKSKKSRKTRRRRRRM